TRGGPARPRGSDPPTPGDGTRGSHRARQARPCTVPPPPPPGRAGPPARAYGTRTPSRTSPPPRPLRRCGGRDRGVVPCVVLCQWYVFQDGGRSAPAAASATSLAAPSTPRLTTILASALAAAARSFAPPFTS